MKILVVCLGNICRSPMAEGILRNKFKEAGLHAEIDSAGTSNYHIGEAPDHRAIANMKQNNHDISTLAARQFTSSDFEKFDRIYVMDKSNYQNVVKLAKNEEQKAKVDLFLNLAYPGEDREVPDPYFGGEEGFQEVYTMLNKAADELIKEVNE